jgi:hypothetical protein
LVNCSNGPDVNRSAAFTPTGVLFATRTHD